MILSGENIPEKICDEKSPITVMITAVLGRLPVSCPHSAVRFINSEALPNPSYNFKS